MKDRSASAALLGYYYQFDKTILEILRLSATSSSVTIEGVEDIDIRDSRKVTAVQCKYLASKSFVPSLLRKPIRIMLEHFSKGSQKFRYKLYLHLKEVNGLVLPLSLHALKKILTPRKSKRSGFSDAVLQSFLSVFDCEIGPTFEEQNKTTVQSLQTAFGCTEHEADFYYYSNALKVVFDLSTNPKGKERVISRDEFLNLIDHKRRLFNHWYCLLKGKQKFVHYLKRDLSETKALAPEKKKWLFLSGTILNGSDSVQQLKRLIKELTEKYFKIGHSFYNSTPWTIVVDLPASKLRLLKKELIKSKIPFNDGFEHLHFSAAIFNLAPILNRGVTQNSKVTNRIAKASYVVSILSAPCFTSHESEIDSPDVAFCLGSKIDGRKLTPSCAVYSLPSDFLCTDLYPLLL